MSDIAHARYQALAEQHPGEVGIVAESVNEYGTPVSVLRCSQCSAVVSICPPTTPEKWGDGCLAEGCASYDIDRDVDMFFDAMAEHGLIEREVSSDG